MAEKSRVKEAAVSDGVPVVVGAPVVAGGEVVLVELPQAVATIPVANTTDAMARVLLKRNGYPMNLGPRTVSPA
ncbi:MAG: hypothetical protein ACYC1D_16475, partial [Acidimicrobiales bacterium]